MKKFTIFICACVALLFASCTLEREEYEKLAEEQFYKNEKDCKAAIANLYTFLSGPHGGPINGVGPAAIPLTECVTDIMYCYWGYDIFYQHTYTPLTIANYVDFFSFARYLTICRGTILRIQEADIPEKLKTEYIAEATLIHAYIALHIYKLIGPVPILPDEDILNPTVVKYYPRPTDEEFVKMIEEEIASAMPNLPTPQEQNKDSEWGRMNTGIANMMLMKLYMMEKNWTEAQKYAQILIDMNCYELEDDYMSIFAVANKRNSEIIYANPRNTSTPGVCNTWHANSLPNVFPTGTSQPKWGGYCILWDFVHTFDSADKRLQGIVTEFVGTDGNLYNEENPGAALRRGAVALKYDIDPNFVGNGSNHDIIIYRYADVLLSMAEILNELNGPTQEALDYFNMIRPRTGLKNMEMPVSKDAFRDSIFVERGHEFYCEGQRYTDMVRMGKYVDWMKETNPTVNPSMIRFPIPNSYIVEYQGKLEQNPGY